MEAVQQKVQEETQTRALSRRLWLSAASSERTACGPGRFDEAQLPTFIKVIKVPCTGRVDVLTMLKAFEAGVDGVYLAGCLRGNAIF